MPRFPTPPRPRRPATRRAGGIRRGSGVHGSGRQSGRYKFAAATAAPALLFASILGVGGVVAWRDPYARPPALPVRRPPVWGLPAAGAALGAATTAGAIVMAQGPGAGFARSRAVRSSAILGLSVAAVPGVMAVAFEVARRTWARGSRGAAGTVVILGCALRGTEPSTLLRLRLEKGAEVARRAPAVTVPATGTVAADADVSPATVIACGGTGADEIVAEAVVMARWLRARGIPDVIEETDSTSTVENLANAEPLVATGPVIVVTSDFHVFRTRRLIRRRGLAGWRVEGSPTPARFWSTSMLREFLALGTMWPLPGIALGAAFAAWGLAAAG